MDRPAVATIASGRTSAAFVPELAMVGCSFRDHGEELLAFPHTLAEYGDGGFATGIPLLFPWANRLGGTSYPGPAGTVDLEPLRSSMQFNGPLPIHGVLPRLGAFSAVSAGPDTLEAELDSAASPAVAAAFPFPLRIRVRAAVAPGVLTIATTLTATGDVPVPITFGYHPYVRLPGSRRDAWRLYLSAQRRLVLDERMIPTGATEPVSIDGLELAGTSLDDGFADLGPEPYACGVRRAAADHRPARAGLPVCPGLRARGPGADRARADDGSHGCASQRHRPAPRRARRVFHRPVLDRGRGHRLSRYECGRARNACTAPSPLSKMWSVPILAISP